MDFTAMFQAGGTLGPPRGDGHRRRAAPVRQPAVVTATLILNKFASAPMLSFGSIAPRASSSRTLRVSNESPRLQLLEVRNLASRDALRVHPSRLEIPANGQAELTVTWMPMTLGNVAKKIELRWNQSSTLCIELQGQCVTKAAAGVENAVGGVARATKQTQGAAAAFGDREDAIANEILVLAGASARRELAPRVPLSPSNLTNQHFPPGGITSPTASTKASNCPVLATEQAAGPTSPIQHAQCAEQSAGSTSPTQHARPTWPLQHPRPSPVATGQDSEPEDLLSFNMPSLCATQPILPRPPPQTSLPPPVTHAESVLPTPCASAAEKVDVPPPQPTPAVINATDQRLGDAVEALSALEHVRRMLPPTPSPQPNVASLLHSASQAVAARCDTMAASAARAANPPRASLPDKRKSSALPGRLRLSKPDPKPATRQSDGPCSTGEDALGFFHDPNWRERRETGFAGWINFYLSAGSTDGAPTAGGGAGERQSLSLREFEDRRQEAVNRRRATSLLRSQPLRPVLTRLEAEVESGLLCVRSPLNLAADVGLRDNLLSLLCCYNPLWLRLGFEAVSGAVAPLGAAADDTHALRRWLDRRVLAHVRLEASARLATLAAAAGRHPDEAWKQAQATAVAETHRRIVRRVLCAVLFLDAAKEGRLLASDPCLFCPDATVKTTKQLLTEFSRSFLSGGIGDVARHLGSLGAPMAHVQTALHEFNFTVQSLATDLRDGARLCRLIELSAAAGGSSEVRLTSNLRLPAVNRTTKLRNAEVALRAIAAAGVPLCSRGAEPAEAAKLLVDGHCEATLELVWNLIEGVAMPTVAPVQAVAAEARRVRRYATAVSALSNGDGVETKVGPPSVVSHLLDWADAVCSGYGVRVFDLGGSLRDGRALLCLVFHYAPEALADSGGGIRAEISRPAGVDKDDEMQLLQAGGWVRGPTGGGTAHGAEARGAARWRLTRFHEALGVLGGVPLLIPPTADTLERGPDEKVATVTLAHLFSRLIQLSTQRRAAQVLQAAGRGRGSHHLSPRDRLRQCAAAIKLQRRWRTRFALREARAQIKAHLCLARAAAARRVRRAYLLQLRAATTIQAGARRGAAAARLRMLRGATLLLQRLARHRATARAMAGAAVVLQAAARRHSAESKLQRARRAVLSLQAAGRRMSAACEVKRRGAARRIQAIVRGRATRRLAARFVAAATSLQAQWRAAACRATLVASIAMVISIQANVRAAIASRSLRRQRSGTITLQSAARRRAAALERLRRHQIQAESQCCLRLQAAARKVAAKRDVGRRRAARTVQSVARGSSDRRRLALQAAAATVFQAAWRSTRCQKAFVNIVAATVAMQAAARRAGVSRDLRQRRARCIQIQALVRGSAQRRIRSYQHAAATRIQSSWRSTHLRAILSASLAAVLAIQAAARRMRVRRSFCILRAACIAIQAAERRWAGAAEVRRRRSARAIQSAARGAAVRRMLATLTAKATRVQSCWRSLLCRRLVLVALAAAVTSQASARRALAVRRWRLQLGACLRLQTAARRYAAVQDLRRHRAARTLQAAARGISARRSIALRHHATTRMQSHWRSLCSRALLAVSIAAAVVVQAAGRRASAVKKLGAAVSACTLVQSYARRMASTTEARRERAARHVQAAARGMFDRRALGTQAQAATVLQAGWRVLTCTRSFAHAVCSIIRAQAAIRRTNAIRQLQYSRWAARHIQAVARGVRERRLADAWTLAAVTIQAQWRSLLCRDMLAVSVAAATILQAAARAAGAMRRFTLAQQAVFYLQAAARCRHALTLVRRERAVRFIGAVARGLAERRACDRWNAAATRIQAARRGAICRRLRSKACKAVLAVQVAARGHVAQRRSARRAQACVRLQAATRRAAARLLLCTLRARVRAATVLQCARRSAAARARARVIRGMLHLAALAQLHKSAALLQACVRLCLFHARRRAAAVVISRRALTVVTMRRRVRCILAILRLQACARGRRTRERSYRRQPELRAIRERLEAAHKRMLEDPSLCLGPRTNSALHTLLSTRNLGHVLASLASLEMFTLISSRVAALMVEEGAVPVMMSLLRTCNRSLPHQKAVSHALRVLANIGRSAPLLVRVWEQPDVVPTLVELAQSYRENEALLAETLELLRLLLVSGPASWRAHAAAAMPECIKRLESVHALALRRGAKAASQKEQRPPNKQTVAKRTGAKESLAASKAAALPDNTARLGQLVAALMSARSGVGAG